MSAEPVESNAVAQGADAPEPSAPGNPLVERLAPFAGQGTAPSAPVPTAAAFTSESMLRPRAQAPEGGWRKAVFRVTGGKVNPGLSAAEQRRRALVAAVKTPVAGSRRIAVISRKGGVGKTTTTLMLGHTFATWRGDRVVALDGNPDAGSLGYRVPRETRATVTDLLDDAHRITRYADIRGYTSQAPTRLEVIASDDDPHITSAIGREEYHTAVRLLEHHYNLILLDTGTGILDSATQGILGVADQLVLVLAPSLDGARAASLTLDWLESNGHSRLVAGAVAVLNQSRQRGLVEVDKLEEHFLARCRGAVRIPWDPTLDAGAETGLEDLAPATRQAYLELAAAVATGFTTT
jgi:putative peptide zinc metalloprotease protein